MMKVLVMILLLALGACTGSLLTEDGIGILRSGAKAPVASPIEVPKVRG